MFEETAAYFVVYGYHNWHEEKLKQKNNGLGLEHNNMSEMMEDILLLFLPSFKLVVENIRGQVSQ